MKIKKVTKTMVRKKSKKSRKRTDARIEDNERSNLFKSKRIRRCS